MEMSYLITVNYQKKIEKSNTIIERKEYIKKGIEMREQIIYLNNSNLYEYAQQIIFNLPPSRIDYYLDSNLDHIKETVIHWSSELTYKIGFISIESDMPILNSLTDYQYLSLFFNLLLDLVISILVFLSVMLIYSLLTVSVETRTYELGIRRMIGYTKRDLFSMLFIQACSYSFPSWICGMIASKIFSTWISQTFESWTNIPVDASLTPFAIILATFLGLSIPIISSIFPIRSALGKNLTESIDHRRSKVVAVKYEISRSDSEPIYWSIVLIGSILFLFGFFIYYEFPLALVSSDLSLLLSIFFAMLIGMISGLVLLSINLNSIFEKIVCYIFFWWESEHIITLTLKNLVAHRMRNRQTSLMYSISLAFVIFVTMSYYTQINTFTLNLQRSIGSDIKVVSSNTDENHLQTGIKIQKSLSNLAKNSKCVKDFSWRSHEMMEVIGDFTLQEISNIGHVYSYSDIRVVATSPNFFDVCVDGFLVVDSRIEEQYQLMDSLYSVIGSSTVILPTTYKSNIGIHTNVDFLIHETADPIQTLISSSESNSQSSSSIDRPSPSSFFGGGSSGPGFVIDSYQRLQGLAFLNKGPALHFSKYPRAVYLNAIVSFPTFIRLSQGYFESIDDIPIAEFFVRYKSDATSDEKKDFKNELKRLISPQPGLSVVDYEEEVESISQADVALSFFFNFITIIAMSICFFSLISSMYTNIHEQKKEIGILLSVGLPIQSLKRIYIYEAFILVFSASLNGVMIGAAVSWTMAIQQILITQITIPFTFPYGLVTTIFIMSVLFAFLSSWIPIRKLLTVSTVEMMKTVT